MSEIVSQSYVVKTRCRLHRNQLSI